MKIRTFFLISLLSGLLVFCSTNSFAQVAVKSGSLQINTFGGKVLTVELRGPQTFEETFTGSVIFSNLLPGEYSLILKSSQRRGRAVPVNQQVVCIDQEQRLCCDIDDRGRFTSHATIDRNSILLIAAGRDYSYNGRTAPQHYGRQPMPEAISQADLNRMITALTRANFDSEKDQIMNASAEYCFYYTEQVKQLLRPFSSDDKRLSWAKRLAPRVLDPNNLYTIGEVFTFLGSKNEYYDFLKNFPPQSR